MFSNVIVVDAELATQNYSPGPHAKPVAIRQKLVVKRDFLKGSKDNPCEGCASSHQDNYYPLEVHVQPIL